MYIYHNFLEIIQIQAIIKLERPKDDKLQFCELQKTLLTSVFRSM